MRISPFRVIGVALALVATACGSRATPTQLATARARTSGGAATAASATGPVAAASGGTSEPGAGNADTAGAASTGTAGGSTSSGASATGSSAAAGPAQTAAAPAGGNGGATDVGVTADTYTLGNVATLSGPVPGIFQGAVIGTQAAVAYLNSKGGMWGRTFKLDVRDDQFDTGQNRAQTIDLLGKAFAFTGSFSLYDDAAIQQIIKSGIPDVTYSLSEARRHITNNFSVQPGVKGWRLGPLNYFKAKLPDAIKSVGTIYGDVPASKSAYDGWKQAAESVGYKIIYERGTAPTETDFTADVVRMRQAGVKMVYLMATDYKATARLAKAMQQQGFKIPFVDGGTAYDAALLTLAGSAADGMINEQQMSMYSGEDAGAVPEVSLFNQWLQKVRPGYKPDVFAVFGWASVRLFEKALQAAGPKATRADVVRELKKIDDFDDNGLVARAGPASKRPPNCYIMIKIEAGKFSRYDSPPPGYRCDDGPYYRYKG